MNVVSVRQSLVAINILKKKRIFFPELGERCVLLATTAPFFCFQLGFEESRTI